MKHGLVFLAVAGGLLGAAGLACAQAAAGGAPIERRLNADSGLLANDAQELAAVYAIEVASEFAPWVRVRFEETALAGDTGQGDGSFIRIVSLTDNAEQILTAEALAQWGYTSALFNGPVVRVEVWSHPGTGPSRVVVKSLIAGPTVVASGPGTGGILDLCGDDNRVPSADNRVARLVGPVGVCTSWMFNDTNHTFLSAGHCAPGQSSVVQFNCPLSDSSGLITNPPPEDQYAVDGASVKKDTVGTSNDWSYFGVFPNSNTGLTPFQRYGGQFYTLAAAPSAVNVANPQTIRCTGYGVVTTPIDPTLNSVQQTDAGPYTFYSTAGTYPIIRYSVDTTGGNSGSPVIDLSTNLAIGIHYLAGCNAGGNQGTACNNANLVAAIAAPLSVCRSGKGTVSGNLYGLGDLNNNFGTVSISPTNYARINVVGAFWTAMTWDYNTSRFYATTSTRELWRLTTAGVGTNLGVISGVPAGGFSGLAYNPKAEVMWGIVAATGQLYQIDIGSMTATAVGPALGMTFHGLAFDTQRNRLWAFSRTTTQAKLVWIDQNTFVVTTVGTYSSTSQTVGDLAFNATDGNLYIVRGDTGEIRRLTATTGAFTVLGSSNSVWPSTGFGLAYANAKPACRPDYDGDGQLNPDDLGDYVTDYFSPAPTPIADWNGDGNVNPDDLGDYITAYFFGC